MIASYTFEGARMTHPTPTPLTLIENGTGRPVLVLHGGGGPASVAVIAQRLSATTHTIVPVHPGWDGTDRPSHLRRAGDYAAAYLQHLHRAELSDVLVVGSSWGGWVGLEMGLQDEAGLLSGLVLIDSVGITVDDEPVADFFALDARQAAEHIFHDAERFYQDPSTVPAAQSERQQQNMATLRAVAGSPSMQDPALLARLGGLAVATRVIWGEDDRIVTPTYGAALADAVPGADFTVVPAAGHLPHVEQPDRTIALIEQHAAATAEASSTLG
jgi:pimeloyl-ACP methyl ester carboxylesterase